MAWRKPPEELVEFFHTIIPDGGPEAPVEFKPMFGGPCYWVHGNMFAAVHQESIIVRLSEADRAEFLQRSGAHQFEPMEGRPMREYVVFAGEMRGDAPTMRAWMERGLAYTASLPPKEKKPRKKKA
jgi:TfoX/Sxy family transcriptional regulator of competence genes